MPIGVDTTSAGVGSTLVAATADPTRGATSSQPMLSTVPDPHRRLWRCTSCVAGPIARTGPGWSRKDCHRCAHPRGVTVCEATTRSLSMSVPKCLRQAQLLARWRRDVSREVTWRGPCRRNGPHHACRLRVRSSFVLAEERGCGTEEQVPLHAAKLHVFQRPVSARHAKTPGHLSYRPALGTQRQLHGLPTKRMSRWTEFRHVTMTDQSKVS